jgi:hypothetical protein
MNVPNTSGMNAPNTSIKHSDLMYICTYVCMYLANWCHSLSHLQFQFWTTCMHNIIDGSCPKHFHRSVELEASKQMQGRK